MMQLSQKTVTIIPIESLWSEKEGLHLFKEKYLKINDIAELLKNSPLSFVIADIGMELKWISDSERFKFFKEEVKIHLITNPDKIDLALLPDKYGYIASHWTGGTSDIILLEKYH